MGKTNAKQVRIYKLDTFDCFTDEEDQMFNCDKANLVSTIRKHKGKRTVKQNRLYLEDGNENERKQIVIFEIAIIF